MDNYISIYFPAPLQEQTQHKQERKHRIYIYIYICIYVCRYFTIWWHVFSRTTPFPTFWSVEVIMILWVGSTLARCSCAIRLGVLHFCKSGSHGQCLVLMPTTEGEIILLTSMTRSASRRFIKPTGSFNRDSKKWIAKSEFTSLRSFNAY